MTVKLIEGGGAFTFNWVKSPFNVWFASKERYASKPEVEEAVRAFVAKTLERDPYLFIKIEDTNSEEMDLL
jgi:hypothetical protein